MMRFFFFNDTATTEIYTLSLHDALPICRDHRGPGSWHRVEWRRDRARGRHHDRLRAHEPHPRDRHSERARGDRKSTRLNSSHDQISYAVFCLKKKNTALVRGNNTHHDMT